MGARKFDRFGDIGRANGVRNLADLFAAGVAAKDHGGKLRETTPNEKRRPQGPPLVDYD
jgi:hypothetical protein